MVVQISKHYVHCMERVSIKKVTRSGVGQLQKIAVQTFYDAFSTGNTEENIAKYLKEGFSVEKLAAELNDKNAEFYFAALDNSIIGYLKLRACLNFSAAAKVRKFYFCPGKFCSRMRAIRRKI